VFTSRSQLPHLRQRDWFCHDPRFDSGAMTCPTTFCRRCSTGVDLQVVPRFHPVSFMACRPLSQERCCRLRHPVSPPTMLPSPASRCGSAFFHVYRRSFPAVADIRDCEVRSRYNLPLHQVSDTNIPKTLSASCAKKSRPSLAWPRLERELALPFAGLSPTENLTSVA